MKTRSVPLLPILGLLLSAACAAPTTSVPTTAPELKTFGFSSPAATGTIAGTTVTVSLPGISDITALKATFTATGTVIVGSETQVSGTSVQNFTNPVVYKVTSPTGAAQSYTVTVIQGLPALIYDANGAQSGSVPTTTAHALGSSAVLGYVPGLTLSNYVFTAWNTESDGTGTVLYPGDSITIASAETRVYAMWYPAPGGDWTAGLVTSQPDYYVPYGVTTIPDNVFASGPSIRHVIIPSTVTAINGNPLYGISKANVIDVSPTSTKFYSVNGVLFSASGKLLAYPPAKPGSDYTVPSGVNAIATNAFANVSNLQTLTIPAEVTTIETTAFKSTFMDSITLLGSTPPAIPSSPNLFAGGTTPTLYVPSAALTVYPGATGWSTYSSDMVGQ